MLRLGVGVIVTAAAAFVLLGQGGQGERRGQVGQGALSPFARAKAEALLRDKLPCLGCHRLDGEGGRIGPNLSGVAVRRSPEHIRAMVRDPQGTVRGAVMPRVAMPAAQLELIVAYLGGQARPERPEPPVAAPGTVGGVDGAALYARYCAACHGRSGGGDGLNAQYLPVPPTAHADSAYMSQRSDDVLFDAISAGGYVMNRSNRMPPFGHTLSPEQIRALVRHMRALCGCEGPAWSRDGSSAR